MKEIYKIGKNKIKIWDDFCQKKSVTSHHDVTPCQHCTDERLNVNCLLFFSYSSMSTSSSSTTTTTITKVITVVEEVVDGVVLSSSSSSSTQAILN